jgi:hypothetical protein
MKDLNKKYKKLHNKWLFLRERKKHNNQGRGEAQ